MKKRAKQLAHSLDVRVTPRVFMERYALVCGDRRIKPRDYVLDYFPTQNDVRVNRRMTLVKVPVDEQKRLEDLMELERWGMGAIWRQERKRKREALDAGGDTEFRHLGAKRRQITSVD